MILIKADTKLRTVYSRLIKTMGEKVEWNGILAVAAGNLILPGKVRSLFFQLDQQKIRSHVTEFPSDFRETEEMEGNDVAANVLNMILYAYGKWGIITGLKVEKDYGQLSKLFQDILRILEVEAEFDAQQLHFFYKENRISYEEVIRKALDWAKFDSTKDEEDEDESALGLWHNVTWRKKTAPVKRIITPDLERRIGHNFYPVEYACPDCGKPLHMVVFPFDKELLVDTEEGRVYLARAYTCADCRCFYTPRPWKLIREGDLYELDFEEDQKAYDDYLNLLGNAGDRCSNYKFNEFEAERNKRPELPPRPLEEACTTLQEMTVEELDQLMEQVEAGFYPPEEVQKHTGAINRAYRFKQKMVAMRGSEGKADDINEKKERKEKKEKKEKPLKTVKSSAKMEDASASAKYGKNRVLHIIRGDLEKEAELEEIRASRKSAVNESVEEAKKDSSKADSTKHKDTGQAGQDQPAKTEGGEGIKPTVKKAGNLKEAADSCKGKTYHQIQDILKEMRQMEGEEGEKERVLFAVTKYKRQQALKETGNLVAGLPANLSRQDYIAAAEKLKGYDADDVEVVRKQLEEKRDIAERHEIDEVIRQSKKKNREEIFALYEELKQGEFTERNVTPYLEKIYKKIEEIDQHAIDKLCPDMLSTSFEDVAEAYQKIAAGMFLPKLKENTLAILDKRLTKIKVDENTQLVRKLKKEMERVISAADQKRIHFYDARSMMSGEVSPEEAAYCRKAMDYIGGNMSKYEFPVIICDTSYFINGKEGLLLTPDRMCYKNLFKSESFSVLGIQEVKETGKMFKLMQIKLTEGRKKKLPGVVRTDRRMLFIKAFGEFISYLQEKPDSRNVSYLVKDKHAVKCCFRCGHHYKGEGACPKCGYRENR